MLKTDFFERNSGPLLFAHRGCSYAAPENTMAAFKRVVDNGIPGVELDVRICATGEMVVFHDDNFKRIFGTEGCIENTDFEVLRALDAGSHKSEAFKGEQIPLLTEVLDLLGKKTILDVELKNPTRETGRQEAELLRIIREYGREETTMVSSFNPLAVKTFRKLAPEIPTAVIYTDSEEMPWYLRRGEGRYIAGTPILKPSGKLINAVYMKKNLRRGYPVFPWTVDDPARAEELLGLGVSGLISNRPEDLKHLFT